MVTRRTVTQGLAALSLMGSYPCRADNTNKPGLRYTKGAALPPIGMGTWLTFNIGNNAADLKSRSDVLDVFFAEGGGMIDSSPMYGRSEDVIGRLMQDRQDTSDKLFSATKIWTPLEAHGRKQLRESHELWKEPILDLVHVHNLLNWDSHLKTLRAAKDRGDIRYLGLTTSHGRRHTKLANLIASEPLDAVQFTYNILDREAERRLLSLSQEKGLTVIINRPFRTGQLFDIVRGKELPLWAVESLGVKSWAEYFLKFIISHPAVNCVIPATRRADHMRQNMRARLGPMPDAKQRNRMIVEFEAI